MMELPLVLQAALQSVGHYSQGRLPVEQRTSRVSRGDLRIMRPVNGAGADVRLGLVLSVDGEREIAQVLLVHTSPELACEVDAIIDPSISSSNYAVIIETDLRGVVWSWQLGPMVGHLAEDAIDALGAVAARMGTTGRLVDDGRGLRRAPPRR